jgi:hypothetical protein
VAGFFAAEYGAAWSGDREGVVWVGEGWRAVRAAVRSVTALLFSGVVVISFPD